MHAVPLRDPSIQLLWFTVPFDVRELAHGATYLDYQLNIQLNEELQRCIVRRRGCYVQLDLESCGQLADDVRWVAIRPRVLFGNVTFES